MATLTEQLDALIAEHGLTSISLTRIASTGQPFWSVCVQDATYAAHDRGHEEVVGVSERLAEALDRLNERRALPVVVPELEAA